MTLSRSMRNVTVCVCAFSPSINSIFNRDCRVKKSAFCLLCAFMICFALSLGLSTDFELGVWVLLHPKTRQTIRQTKKFLIVPIELR